MSKFSSGFSHFSFLDSRRRQFSSINSNNSLNSSLIKFIRPWKLFDIGENGKFQFKPEVPHESVFDEFEEAAAADSAEELYFNETNTEPNIFIEPQSEINNSTTITGNVSPDSAHSSSSAHDSEFDADAESELADDSSSDESNSIIPRIYNLQYSPSGSLLVCACSDGRSRVLDPRINGFQLASGPNYGHTEAVNTICFNSDSSYLTGSDDNSIKLWDLRSMDRPVLTLLGHSNWVKNVECVNFIEAMKGGNNSNNSINSTQIQSGSLNYIFSSGFDGTVRLWNLLDSTTNSFNNNNNNNNLINNSDDNSLNSSRLFFTAPDLIRMKYSYLDNKLIFSTRNHALILVHDVHIGDLLASANNNGNNNHSDTIGESIHSSHSGSFHSPTQFSPSSAGRSGSDSVPPVSSSSFPLELDSCELQSASHLFDYGCSQLLKSRSSTHNSHYSSFRRPVFHLPRAILREKNRLEIIRENGFYCSLSIQLPSCVQNPLYETGRSISSLIGSNPNFTSLLLTRAEGSAINTHVPSFEISTLFDIRRANPVVGKLRELLKHQFEVLESAESVELDSSRPTRSFPRAAAAGSRRSSHFASAAFSSTPFPEFHFELTDEFLHSSEFDSFHSLFPNRQIAQHREPCDSLVTIRGPAFSNCGLFMGSPLQSGFQLFEVPERYWFAEEQNDHCDEQIIPTSQHSNNSTIRVPTQFSSDRQLDRIVSRARLRQNRVGNSGKRLRRRELPSLEEEDERTKRRRTNGVAERIDEPTTEQTRSAAAEYSSPVDRIISVSVSPGSHSFPIRFSPDVRRSLANFAGSRGVRNSNPVGYGWDESDSEEESAPSFHQLGQFIRHRMTELQRIEPMKLIRNLTKTHSAAVYTCRIHPTDTLIATGSHDGSVRFYQP